MKQLSKVKSNKTTAADQTKQTNRTWRHTLQQKSLFWTSQNFFTLTKVLKYRLKYQTLLAGKWLQLKQEKAT